MSTPLDLLLERLRGLPAEAGAAFGDVQSEAELNQVKARYVGKAGVLKEITQSLRDVSPAERPVLGQAVNQASDAISQALEARREALRDATLSKDLRQNRVDLTLPGRRPGLGAIHPLNRVLREIIEIFRSMGYEVATGPEVETDFYNFEALNFPPEHPARDMQDTFLLKNGHLLRTHTSPVQIRTMLGHVPPIRVIMPGTVYRCDADITHSPMFHQVEGLLVDKGISLAHLKGTLESFARRFYGRDVDIRLRPSFFPFTEPSCEVDVACVFCPPQGSCRVCKDSHWVEVLGAGMVDPNVFLAAGYDPEQVSGFAFGMGVERLAMLKHGIGDIRTFFENDVRFLRQFA